MRSLLAVSALLLASACTSGTIEGSVLVGPGQDGLAIVTVLWQVQTVQVDPADPSAGTKDELVALGQTAIGTAAAEGGTFPYSFHSLAKGRYLVGAYADLGDDRVPTTDEFSVDLIAPFLEIDPDDASKETQTRDIYLARSAPSMGTIKGVVHRSAAAATKATELLVLGGPLNDPNAQLIAQRTLPPGTQDVSYTIFNVPEGDAHVIALDDFTLRGNVAVFPRNPLIISLNETREATGVDLWLDRQAPDLGGIRGSLTFNASLANLSVQLLAFASDPTVDPEAALVGLVNVSANNLVEAPFDLKSTPLGRLYLAAFVSTTEGSRTLSTSRVYRLGSSATAIETTAQAPQVSGIRFPLGVGRVSGLIEVTNAPANLEIVLVASVGPLISPIQGQGEIRQNDFIVAPGTGTHSFRYEMFGLEDGSFDMTAIPDSNKSGDFNDELNSSPPFAFAGTPGKVEIIGGGRVGCDFKIPLAAP